MSGYRVRGKVELDRRHTQDPVNNGIPLKSLVGIDLDAIDDQGELDNERVIAAGLAHLTRIEVKRENGSTYALYEGKGTEKEPDGSVKRFPYKDANGFEVGREHAGYTVPAAGYELDEFRISPIEHSNGFRAVLVVREEGYFTV